MTPHEFLARVERGAPAPAYLFLGPEAYYRDICKRALIERMLPPDQRQDGFIRHDLDEVSLSQVLDDARSYSLFAPRRVIWVASAEAEDSETAAAELARYLQAPTPDVVLVFEACRFDFTGEDKNKLERVRKFYSAAPAQVEFPRFTPQAARQLAQDLARRAGLTVDPDDLDLLVEALGADAARIAVEIEKLRLYAGARKVERDEIAVLIPDARSTTIFALVNALARRDRIAALGALDTLVREGEYLPLALTFLATLFRLALVAREAGLRTPLQVQSHFSRIGTPMWRSRAEQVSSTAATFSPQKLQEAIRTVFAADRALRDTRPDDRVVMEDFVLRLTR